MNGNVEPSEEKDLGQFFTSMLGLQKHLLATVTAQGRQQSAAFADLLAEVSAKLDRAPAPVRLALPSLTDDDDAVTYLSLFERAAATARLPERQWASALASRLTGEAEAARRAVGAGGGGPGLPGAEGGGAGPRPAGRGDVPGPVPLAWPRRRGVGAGLGLRPRALARELQAAASGWLKPHRRSGAEVLQCVVVEQFTARLPELTAGWVRAGRPADLDQAVRLAESHISLSGAGEEEAGGGPRGDRDEPSDREKRHCAAPGIGGSETGHTSACRHSAAVSHRKDVQVGSSEAASSRGEMDRESPAVRFTAADSRCDREEEQQQQLCVRTLKTESAAEMKEESADSCGPAAHAYSPCVQQGAPLFASERSHGGPSPSSSLEEEELQGGGGWEASSERVGGTGGGGAFPWPGGEPGCNATSDHRGALQQQQQQQGSGPGGGAALHLRRRIHSGEKPYACPVCAHAFRTSTALKRHRDVHTGAKLYQCPDCGKSFTYAERMLHHRTAHAALRPHRCAACGKSFRLKKQLRKHERTKKQLRKHDQGL
ncbi:hypothetical protein AAFF_G00216400 [Aldrovandia affinis]|uniref:Uncharacterized protein n=1 Tax=Aldrovandia affinis TaxID=143900 RepID=A0AAD7W5K0_9TELE|nr:hypothetical protein AAFF_G00216400 [Aldrovandia affinis]